ncbi:hypothetical protein DICVIV_09180 [Dictyocaulus viviparus]|uniref:Arrestin-like N-terminal domain-containing protein n=1 Tax=Dictyocaulus viviparus TaxID=29172 RepID=A0A0D8XJQ9_DICVI|nr:hypothetical protein DICVIV_09180 [Dictyocaulus viviparus]
MLNVSSTVQSNTKDNLIEFMVELVKHDGCYTPGDTLRGKFHLKLSEGSIDITSLRATLIGLGRVNAKGKREECLQKSLLYLRKEWTVIGSPVFIDEREQCYNFEVG